VEWLTLREDADAKSRSRSLARAASRLLEAPIVVHDLGSGTGSMMRWLAPLLPGPQTWVLHDWNPALLDHAAARASDSSGHPATVHTSVRGRTAAER
jgi:ubiquinone/menaquinone biosynthesis C-methylase UbiE